MSKTSRTKREQQIHELLLAQSTMRRALAALAYQATGPHDIAAKLRTMSIFGANFSSRMHPVAVYLNLVTALDYVRIGPKTIHYSVDMMKLPPEEVPEIIWQFVAAFDSGRYPDLELETQTECCPDGRCEYCSLSLLVCKCFPAPAGLMPV